MYDFATSRSLAKSGLGMTWPRLLRTCSSVVEPGGLARSSLVWAPAARHAPRWDGARFLARCGGFWDERLCALGMTVGLWGWHAAPGATQGDNHRSYFQASLPRNGMWTPST